MNNLDPRIEQQLRDSLAAVIRRGDAQPPERLQSYYKSFRERFGPERLTSIDGQSLLQTMHTHGNKESLVYWLEFKNDEEFPGQMFGSIAGGSAHKFGLFRRKDSGQWVKGSPQSEENISEADAIEVARSHRDDLVAAAALLEKLPANATDEQYLALQQELEKTASEIIGLAWTHKYLSLLFPDKLDDYHNHHWQRFNLIKVLQLPPETEGLYVAAGRFVRLATHFGWPVNHLTFALNERNGRPINYWRIGTRLGEKESIWSAMRDGNYIAIGWDAIGDLAPFVTDADLKDKIREKLQPYYSDDAKTLSRKAGEIRNFANRIEEGDIAVAADGQTVLGLGKVTGPYRFESTEPVGAPHRHSVEWISTAEWNLPNPEGLRTTVFAIGKFESNLVEIEKRLLEGSTSLKTKTPPIAFQPQRFDGILGRVQRILDRKAQAILYGPPGTGKTFWGRRTALDLAGFRAFGKSFDQLSHQEKTEVAGTPSVPGLVRTCTFHPAYGYEDFIEGFRPQLNDAGTLTFQLRDGIFKQICADARKKTDQKFFLVIDEINRGDIPRIFGELLTLLELDKRGIGVVLPTSHDHFAVPANVYVLGTMNTADRSIALLDIALRRRFGFVELMPDMTVFGGSLVGDSIPLGAWLAALNDRIRAHLGRDARNLQIGHAYFLENGKAITEFARFVSILSEDIIPLLEEYCYEDYGMLTKILGKDMVDEPRQRIREELFAPAKRDELVQALLSPSPEIVTSAEIVALPMAESDDAESESDEK